MVGELNFTFAPPSKLVTSFFVVGVIFYLVASFVFLRVDFLNISYIDPKSVGFVHIFLVGFVMSVIFGAMYQLISVILEIPLYSNNLAYMHLALFVIGVVPFFISFLSQSSFEFLGYGSLLLYLSFLLYLINIALSLKKLKKLEIKSYFIITIHVILFLGVTYGLLASLGLVHDSLEFDILNLAHTHIALVLFGFVGGLIAIIATVLLPMFMLSHKFNKQISNYILIGIIASTFFALFEWFLLVKLIVFILILAFVYQLHDIYKKRLRKHIDIYAKNMILSAISLVILAILAPFLSSEVSIKLFFIFLILGFLGAFVMGHIYKIVPFLVWNDKFAPLVGKQKVPLLADMLHNRLVEYEFYFRVATVLFLTVGLIFGLEFLILLAKIVFFINALLVVANVIYIFRYEGIKE